MTQALGIRDGATTPARTATARVATWAAAAMTLAGVVQALTGLTTTADPDLANPRTVAFVYAGIELSVTHLVVLVAAVSLAFSAAAGTGWLRRIGFGVALPGLLCLVLGESILRIDFNTGNTFFGIAMPLTAVGMIVAGIGVIRAGQWRGWHRFTPLVCGLYIPVVLIPVFAIAKGPNFLALAGFGFVFALLGLAMHGEAR